MHVIGYLFYRWTLFVFRFIPFPILYLWSGFVQFLLQRVFKYRLDVSETNIRQSFPEKSDSEIKKIVSGSYRNLADILLESLKGVNLSEREILKRYPIRNPEILDKYFEEGRHVIACASHYSNWEWGALSIGYQLKHRILGFVKPIKNTRIYNYVRFEKRRPNVEVTSIYDTQKALVAFQDKPTLFVFITDQTPSNIRKSQWVDFLNRDTPCLHGADRIAREHNWPVILLEISRIKRGHYEVEIKIIEEEPQQTKDGEITAKYMWMLEDQIQRKPENWLWSHRRWKRAHQIADNTFIHRRGD